MGYFTGVLGVHQKKNHVRNENRPKSMHELSEITLKFYSARLHNDIQVSPVISASDKQRIVTDQKNSK